MCDCMFHGLPLNYNWDSQTTMRHYLSWLFLLGFPCVERQFVVPLYYGDGVYFAVTNR